MTYFSKYYFDFIRNNKYERLDSYKNDDKEAAQKILTYSGKALIVGLSLLTMQYEGLIIASTTSTGVALLSGSILGLEAFVLSINLDDNVAQTQKTFINNYYFLFTILRLGGPTAIRLLASTTTGSAAITKFLGSCKTFGLLGNTYIGKLAKQGLDELGVIVCFTAGTPIAAEHGQVPIEKIKAKDKVWSWSFEKNAVVLQEVVQTFKKTTNQLIHLFIGKDTIHTTPEHPFFVPQTEQIYASTDNGFINSGEKGVWVAAKNLRKGTKIFLLSTLLTTVDSTFAQDTICTVYNFEVANTHNYFVGEEGVLVHNTCDVEAIITSIKSGGYFDDLTNSFQKKYTELFDLLRTEKDALKLQELIANANIALEIKEIKLAFPLQFRQEIMGRNIIYGEYEMLYNNTSIKEKFISISGSKTVFGNMPQAINIKGVNYKVIFEKDYGQAFTKEVKVFQHASTLPNRAHDSELQFYRYLSVTSKEKFGISIADNISEFQKIKGEIKFISEMDPCPSCVNIIDSQARSYFGLGMKIPTASKIPYAIKHY